MATIAKDGISEVIYLVLLDEETVANSLFKTIFQYRPPAVLYEMKLDDVFRVVYFNIGESMKNFNMIDNSI